MEVTNKEIQLRQGELERLRKIYPLFKFHQKDNHLEVEIEEGHTFYPKIVNGCVDHASDFQIKIDHMQKSISEKLMKLYPDLFLITFADKDGCEISAWVKRDNDDAEAINHIEITDTDLHKTLEGWQNEAHQAKQDGWFFCSGHLKAEPQSDYGYFHFAGRYCKRYGEEHPDSLKEARNESYL